MKNTWKDSKSKQKIDWNSLEYLYKGGYQSVNLIEFI